MSNIGKKPISIPEGIEVKLVKNHLDIKGKLGDLSLDFDQRIKVAVEGEFINVSRGSNQKTHRELHGLYRALIANMILGVSLGFKKELIFVGVGYGVEKKGDFILINAGFSHPIFFQIPKNINIEVASNTNLIIQGCSKQNVGDVAAKIREIRKPEPYKGKGIKYSDEYVRRKAGKTVGGATAV